MVQAKRKEFDDEDKLLYAMKKKMNQEVKKAKTFAVQKVVKKMKQAREGADGAKAETDAASAAQELATTKAADVPYITILALNRTGIFGLKDGMEDVDGTLAAHASDAAEAAAVTKKLLAAKQVAKLIAEMTVQVTERRREMLNDAMGKIKKKGVNSAKRRRDAEAAANPLKKAKYTLDNVGAVFIGSLNGSSFEAPRAPDGDGDGEDLPALPDFMNPEKKKNRPGQNERRRVAQEKEQKKEMWGDRYDERKVKGAGGAGKGEGKGGKGEGKGGKGDGKGGGKGDGKGGKGGGKGGGKAGKGGADAKPASGGRGKDAGHPSLAPGTAAKAAAAPAAGWGKAAKDDKGNTKGKKDKKGKVEKAVHPSWAAKLAAKEKASVIPVFAGKKITFD
jgi:hypothetical protein